LRGVFATADHFGFTMSYELIKLKASEVHYWWHWWNFNELFIEYNGIYTGGVFCTFFLRDSRSC